MKRRKGLLDEEKFLPPLPEQLPRGVSSLPGYGQTSPVAQGLLGFTGRNPTYSVMDPQAQEMSDAYRLGEQASVASQLYGSVLPFAAASTMASAQRAGSLLSPLTVFHGSPHKFSKFDASKIGTGEGAQAYGHGIYTAEARNVAEQYANMPHFKQGMVENPEILGRRLSKDFIGRVEKFGSVEKARQEAKELLAEMQKQNIFPAVQDQLANEIELANRYGNKLRIKPTGFEPHLYTVDLPDEQIAKMLDWDKPLSQQKDVVKNISPESLGLTYTQLPNGNHAFVNQEGKILGNLQKGGTQETFTKNWMSDVMRGTGQDLYKMLGQGMERGPEVTSALQKAGVPGIRYLDQGSRGNYQAQTTYKGKPYGDVVSFATQKQLDDYVAEKTAEGFGVNKLPQSSNFVVFPGEESKLRIMEVNGRPVVIDKEELRRSGLLGQGVAR